MKDILFFHYFLLALSVQLNLTDNDRVQLSRIDNKTHELVEVKEEQEDEENESTKSTLSTLAETCPSEATTAVVVADSKTSLDQVVPSSGKTRKFLLGAYQYQ